MWYAAWQFFRHSWLRLEKLAEGVPYVSLWQQWGDCRAFLLLCGLYNDIRPEYIDSLNILDPEDSSCFVDYIAHSTNVNGIVWLSQLKPNLTCYITSDMAMIRLWYNWQHLRTCFVGVSLHLGWSNDYNIEIFQFHIFAFHIDLSSYFHILFVRLWLFDKVGILKAVQLMGPKKPNYQEWRPETLPNLNVVGILQWTILLRECHDGKFRPDTPFSSGVVHWKIS